MQIIDTNIFRKEKSNIRKRHILRESGQREEYTGGGYTVMMMKASFKGKFDVDKSGGVASLSFNAGNAKLRATMTDTSLIAGPSLNGLSLAVEKPGFFIIDYNVPRKVTPFSYSQY